MINAPAREKWGLASRLLEIARQQRNDVRVIENFSWIEEKKTTYIISHASDKNSFREKNSNKIISEITEVKCLASGLKYISIALRDTRE